MIITLIFLVLFSIPFLLIILGSAVHKIYCKKLIQNDLFHDKIEELEEVADKFCEIGNINPLSKEEIEQSVNLFRMKEN